MRYDSKHLLLVATCVLSLQPLPVTSHKHKKLNHTIGESTKKDIVSPAVSFAASVASTYVMNWLKKTKNVLATISNLSSEYLIFDECDGSNVEIPVAPTNLAPGKIGSEMETLNPAGIFTNAWQKIAKENLWVRCAYETNFRDTDNRELQNDPTRGYNPRSKIVFLASLRTTGATMGWEPTDTTLAIAMCEESREDSSRENTCGNFGDIKSMRKAVEQKIDDQSKGKDKTYPNMRIATFDKKKEGQVLKPIYYCNRKANHCVSATMGNGGNAVVQIFIHDFQEQETFEPKQIKPELPQPTQLKQPTRA